MKKIHQFLAIVCLASASGLAMADSVPVDEALRLVKTGTIQDFEKLNASVLAKYPGASIIDSELERQGQSYIYELEVRDAKGVKWDIEVDAVSGVILREKED